MTDWYIFITEHRKHTLYKLFSGASYIVNIRSEQNPGISEKRQPAALNIYGEDRTFVSCTFFE